MQNFKDTDDKEAKIRDAALPFLEGLGVERDAFLAGAFTCFVLGDVLFELKISPLADSIPQDAFRASFYAIHNLFTRPGTFEFYLDVFRAIFGASVDVEFVIPEPGHLQINIESLSVLQEDFLARRIVNNVYVFDEVVDEDGDNIAFQEALGIKTQSEIDALVAELYPAGLIVEADLTLV